MASGRTIPTVGGTTPLERIDPDLTVVGFSADKRLVLARKLLGTDTTGWQTFLWSIYSLESGERIAEVRNWVAGGPFSVWKSRLLYASPRHSHRVAGKWTEEPLEVRAIDLQSGAEVWRHPLRDIAYRGPLPGAP
jgi:hypothetical protein